MKYFLHTKLRGIKNINQNKTKQISKRGKDKVWERLFGFWFGRIFFATFFKWW